ncbi:MAG: hypothetical protein B6I30_10060 [Desulfobacteraceae bacterium 4572_187]|nr:MAG: hypothetical protein B6I30_10060 [Desulfobacteraceae bacterium 4572_187]
MKISFYHRFPGLGFSIERLFNDIRGEMPPYIQKRAIYARFSGTNPFKMLWNSISAIFCQGDINHITGDIHYLSLFLKKRKTVLTIHDCVSLERLNGWKWRLFYLLWYWLPVQRSAIVTVISESTKHQVLHYLKCPSDKIRVIYDCVSEVFAFQPKPFDEKKPVILQVGTGHNKNLTRIVEALRGISCHLRIIGKLNNEQRNSLEANMIEYSSVADISDADLVQEYRQCDMLVFVSTYEGFGLPIIEAQAIGRPVVTSNIFSMPEVAGNGACIVNPFNIKNIQRGIERIIQNSSYRESLINNGLTNVEKFRPKVISDKYIEIYKELIA